MISPIQITTKFKNSYYDIILKDLLSLFKKSDMTIAELGIDEWRKGFELLETREAVKVVLKPI